ncbi:HNH endonuclease [Psychrobacillus sp. NPDC093180]|uniref:HNH endonuclease n=1 Tax=Psychrobacillus sp. NPDC093180 TaxID=3364489 RepID=UPI0038258449
MQHMHAMETWIHNIEDMFNNNLTDIHFQTDRWAELASCSPPLTITTPTNEAEMCLREVEEEKSAVDTGLEVVDGILTGLFDVGKDFVTGIVDIIQDPKATLDATVEAVTNPIETFNVIKSAISTSYERDMVNGDANSRAHWVTYALGTVATSIVGTKGVGALTKSGVAATKAAVPRVSGAVNNASASLANLLPYGPRPQFAIAGEVPYNAVNANGLKDQIISMARVESGVKGTGNVKGSEIDEVIKNDYDINGNVINRSIVPKGYESVEKFLEVVDDTTIKEYGYDNIEEFKAVVGHVETYLNASPKNNIVNKALAGGKHVKGVDYDILGFPIFKGDDVKFSLKLKENLYKATDDTQFKESTRLLKEAIEQGKTTTEIFTTKQLRDIENGEARIKGLTWHHHQVPGKMQLVVSKTHKVNHLGGNKLWGDGIR